MGPDDVALEAPPQTVSLDIPETAAERLVERYAAQLGMPVILVNPDGSRNVRGQTEFAAMITRVNDDDGTVALTAFLPNRGPELHVNIRHQHAAKVSDRFHWRHVMEPALDALAKSGQP